MAPLVPPVELPLILKIPGGLNPDRTLYFEGRVHPVAHWFEISLHCGPEDTADIAFVLRINFNDEYANFTVNSRVDDVWDNPMIHLKDTQIKIAAKNEGSKENDCKKKISVTGYKPGVIRLSFPPNTDEDISTSSNDRRSTLRIQGKMSQVLEDVSKTILLDDENISGDDVKPLNKAGKNKMQELTDTPDAHDKKPETYYYFYRVKTRFVVSSNRIGNTKPSETENILAQDTGPSKEKSFTAEFEKQNYTQVLESTSQTFKNGKEIQDDGQKFDEAKRKSTDENKMQDIEFEKINETSTGENKLQGNAQEFENKISDDDVKPTFVPVEESLDRLKLNKRVKNGFTHENRFNIEEYRKYEAQYSRRKHENMKASTSRGEVNFESKPSSSKEGKNNFTLKNNDLKPKTEAKEDKLDKETNKITEAQDKRPDNATDSPEIHNKKPRTSNYFYRVKTSYVVAKKSVNIKSNSEIGAITQPQQEKQSKGATIDNLKAQDTKPRTSNYYYREKTNYVVPDVAVMLQKVLSFKTSKTNVDNNSLKREEAEKSNEEPEKSTYASVLLGTKYEYLKEKIENEYPQELDIIEGDAFFMTLECLENGYIVTLNDELFCVYPHTVSNSRVTHVMVDGDIDIQGLEVAGGKGPDRTMVMDLYPELVWTSTVTTLTDDNFDSYVIENHYPWMVMVYTAWCPACLKMRSHWEEAAGSVPQVKFGVIDADRNEELTDYLYVPYYPMIFFFHDDKLGKKTEVYDGPRLCDSLVAYAKYKSEGHVGMPPTVKPSKNLPKTIRKFRQRLRNEREYAPSTVAEDNDAYKTWHKFECGEKTSRHVGIDKPKVRVCRNREKAVNDSKIRPGRCSIL